MVYAHLVRLLVFSNIISCAVEDNPPKLSRLTKQQIQGQPPQDATTNLMSVLQTTIGIAGRQLGGLEPAQRQGGSVRRLLKGVDVAQKIIAIRGTTLVQTCRRSPTLYGMSTLMTSSSMAVGTGVRESSPTAAAMVWVMGSKVAGWMMKERFC